MLSVLDHLRAKSLIGEMILAARRTLPCDKARLMCAIHVMNRSFESPRDLISRARCEGLTAGQHKAQGPALVVEAAPPRRHLRKNGRPALNDFRLEIVKCSNLAFRSW